MDSHAAERGGRGGDVQGGSEDAEGRKADVLLKEADMEPFISLLRWNFPRRE